MKNFTDNVNIPSTYKTSDKLVEYLYTITTEYLIDSNVTIIAYQRGGD